MMICTYCKEEFDGALDNGPAFGTEDGPVCEECFPNDLDQYPKYNIWIFIEMVDEDKDIYEDYPEGPYKARVTSDLMDALRIVSSHSAPGWDTEAVRQMKNLLTARLRKKGANDES